MFSKRDNVWILAFDYSVTVALAQMDTLLQEGICSLESKFFPEQSLAFQELTSINKGGKGKMKMANASICSPT